MLTRGKRGESLLRDKTRQFLRRLALANVGVAAVFAVLALVFIWPQCPGETCEMRKQLFLSGMLNIFAFGNLLACSIYFLWGKR